MEHQFTPKIKGLLCKNTGKHAEEIYKNNELIGYLNLKTRSASRGSKSRSAFGNLYAIYVLVEDYVNRGFVSSGNYNEYEGARFSDLHERQRQLPFGRKLQNYSLNHRVNQEFTKFFPMCEHEPIIRDVETKRYWINEHFLKVCVRGKKFNIVVPIVEIIDAYVAAKRDAFENFMSDCIKMINLQKNSEGRVHDFIRSWLEPSADARIFEIVSYAILKEYYKSQSIFWGWARDDVREELLFLYKTGRTNANDGGIDFVMRPLGRFFQVTETIDVKKYFLDIDKIKRFPLTFVIKSNESPQTLRRNIESRARSIYPVSAVVEKYMSCIEEIINVDILLERFDKMSKSGKVERIIDEIVLQSRIEFNYE